MLRTDYHSGNVWHNKADKADYPNISCGYARKKNRCTRNENSQQVWVIAKAACVFVPKCKNITAAMQHKGQHKTCNGIYGNNFYLCPAFFAQFAIKPVEHTCKVFAVHKLYHTCHASKDGVHCNACKNNPYCRKSLLPRQ